MADRQTALTGIHKNWPADKTLTIKTDRFVIRSVAGRDIVERLRSWFSDTAFRRSFPGQPVPETLEQLKERLRPRQDGAKRTLVICHDDKPIGIYWIDADKTGELIGTHHFIGDRRYWGKGVIHETRAFLLDGLFKLGAVKI